jgi:GTP cyclohydrolase I
MSDSQFTDFRLAPFCVQATIGHVLGGKRDSLSKLKCLVDDFVTSLQMQERLAIQIPSAMSAHPVSEALNVVIRCRHLRMENRGIFCSGMRGVAWLLRTTI